jgi:hypothetical protein
MVTSEQRDILRHALGLGRSDREYRNHFVTGPGSADYPHCQALVAEGLMTRRDGHPLSGGDPVFSVTEAGRTAARRLPNFCDSCAMDLETSDCSTPRQTWVVRKPPNV